MYKPPLRPSKVLLFDIETSPNVVYTWGIWEQNALKVQKCWEIISVAWKWLDEKEVRVISQRNKTEKEICTQLYSLFDEADIAIAHNGDNFDIKKVRAKLIKFFKAPPSPLLTIDTKKIAKSQFAFNSNSLNDLANYLGFGSKKKTGGIDLWFDCEAGVDSAWRQMEQYNKHDVVLLEKAYMWLRPWAKTLPIISDPDQCPACGSSELQRRGYRVRAGGPQARMNCQSCGHWFTVSLKRSEKMEQKACAK